MSNAINNSVSAANMRHQILPVDILASVLRGDDTGIIFKLCWEHVGSAKGSDEKIIVPFMINRHHVNCAIPNNLPWSHMEINMNERQVHVKVMVPGIDCKDNTYDSGHVVIPSCPMFVKLQRTGPVGNKTVYQSGFTEFSSHSGRHSIGTDVSIQHIVFFPHETASDNGE